MQNPDEIRIAVIDDDEDDYFIISDYISEIEGKKFTIDWYKDYPAALQKIKEKAYHLYFVDYRLGNQTGLELLEEASLLGCDDPIVLLTGKGNKAIDIRAMESGATDYLIKSELNTEKLERCIRYSLERSAFLKELKAREIKYRNLFARSKDAVFIADQQLSLLEVNDAASQLSACPMEQLSARSLYEFIPDEKQKQKISKALETERDIDDLEIRFVSDDREIKICLLTLTFQEDVDSGRLVHGIIHDITNIRKAELANLQAEKLSANERLVRMLAHEIRNPLNNISLSIENLQLTYNDVARRENLLNILQRNSTRINQIITELLNLTKPVELVFEKYTLQEILDESLANASDRLDLQKIRVEKNYSGKPLEIAADKSKLTIAFNNILINAIESMESNKGQLSVSVAESGNMYMVSIRDNGTGIPEEYLSKLFEPFFTLKKNGMGLGLAASYSIIQSHKGVVQVESTVNKGTNFMISFEKANLQ